MEAFSLLKYWRTSSTTSNVGHATTDADVSTSTAATTTTIVTAVTSQPSETGDQEGDDDDNDNGPFFDLEFSLPIEEDEAEEQEQEVAEEDEDDDSNGSSGDSTEDVNISVTDSPSDELFFNGGFVPVEQTEKKIRSKSISRPSLIKPATKLRIMMLKFKNLSSNGDSIESTGSNSNEEQQEKKEINHVPNVSLFKRRNGSKPQNKLQNDVESVSASSNDMKFSKETMQKYLRKVKPLYVRVSKRYGTTVTKRNLEHETDGAIEKESKLEVSEAGLVNNNVKAVKQGNLPAGLRVVCKQLRKSRSGFTAVAAVPPGVVLSNRRDDSLLQQQDDSDCSSSGGDPVPPDGNSISSDAAEEKDKEKEEVKKK
ncbi:hypothetical protein M8C21_031242 [Ambrosia artemisiifolia]|uniref:Membrane-associated kinase regulator 2 n=1 Tax=Ambrosia artemisiifolia TaxID=4212 RepID=A0AAD5BZ04_AMBAR|nr:hypothetical protein M8C21_031242 [Ambrosia artemisiifolia]